MKTVDSSLKALSKSLPSLLFNTKLEWLSWSAFDSVIKTGFAFVGSFQKLEVGSFWHSLAKGFLHGVPLVKDYPLIKEGILEEGALITILSSLTIRFPFLF